MKLAIIINPISGGGRAFASLKRYVAQWPHPNWEVQLLATRTDKHAGLIAQDLIKQPLDLLAVCGGDGTINEVASCIPQSPFPIAVLPAGTANVLARELGLPLDPIRALQIALKRMICRVDLGGLEGGSNRRFLFVAGVGYDAYVVSRVRPKLKRRLGKAAFVIEAVRGLRDYSFPEFQVVVDNRTFTATSCLACNTRSYGGGLKFSPEADMTDGLLDVLIVQGRHTFELAHFLLLSWLGKTATHDWVHRLQIRSLKINGPAEVLVQTDGELAGHLPINISLDNLVFPLIVP